MFRANGGFSSRSPQREKEGFVNFQTLACCQFAEKDVSRAHSASTNTRLILWNRALLTTSRSFYTWLPLQILRARAALALFCFTRALFVYLSVRDVTNKNIIGRYFFLDLFDIILLRSKKLFYQFIFGLEQTCHKVYCFILSYSSYLKLLSRRRHYFHFFATLLFKFIICLKKQIKCCFAICLF